jgi:hypothetical protein
MTLTADGVEGACTVFLSRRGYGSAPYDTARWYLRHFHTADWAIYAFVSA